MRRSIFVAAAAALVGITSFANAGALAPNNLVVERVNGTAAFGAGAAALTSAGTAVFLDEALKSAQVTPVQTIPMPTTAIGAQKALVDSGSATSNGFITRSVDGSTIVIPGYNGTVGLASIAGSNPATVNRVIGRLYPDGTVDTSKTFDNGPLNNYRSVASIDGNSFYTTTAGAGGASPTVGLGYHNGAATSLATINNGNLRNIGIFGGSIFVSSASGVPGVGLHVVTGTPTGATASTPLTLTGSPSGTASPYGFWFFDLTADDFSGTGLDTLYVADDRAVASNGGLLKYNWNGTSWAYAYTLSAGLGTVGLRGLTGELVAGVPTLYATTALSNANSLVSVSDTGATSPYTTLLTAPANTAFRGVALTPVPEPTTLGLAAVTALGLLARRRKA